MLDDKRSDSLQGVFSAAIANVTAENSVLSKSVRAVVEEAVKPLASEVNKLAQQIREQELVESVLEQSSGKSVGVKTMLFLVRVMSTFYASDDNSKTND